MRSRITLVEWEQQRDLRYVNQNVDFLNKEVRRHGLSDGQGCLYSNKLLDRFRIVAVIGDMPVLIVPPVAKSGELLLSIFLRVSIFVRSLSPVNSVSDSLDVHIESTKARLSRVNKIRASKRRRARRAA